MPKLDPDLLIEDMLASVRTIERYTSGSVFFSGLKARVP